MVDADPRLASAVTLRRNVTDGERSELLASCAAVVYTPSDEHFGIVPLEAMAAGRPVIAVCSGGPCETVIHGSTGWLCQPSASAFAAAFDKVRRLARTDGGAGLRAMGDAARRHVEASFSLDAFGAKLEAHAVRAAQ